MKDEFLKFAADIFAKLRTREYLNVIHVTVEKQSNLSGLRCKIVNSATIYTRLSVSETFILRFNLFNVGEERNSEARSTGPFAKINNIISILFKIFTLVKLRQSFLHAS